MRPLLDLPDLVAGAWGWLSGPSVPSGGVPGGGPPSGPASSCSVAEGGGLRPTLAILVVRQADEQGAELATQLWIDLLEDELEL